LEQKQLHADLHRLHNELSSLTVLDSESQQLLAHLKNDIQKVLEHPGEESSEPHNALLQRLSDSTGYFEVSHPGILAIVNNVIATLNNLGI
jgi:hypothetical protein